MIDPYTTHKQGALCFLNTGDHNPKIHSKAPHPPVRQLLAKSHIHSGLQWPLGRGREKYLRYFEVFLEGKNTQSTQKNTWNFY